MRIWKQTYLDAWLLGVALAQIGLVAALAWLWPAMPMGWRVAAVAAVVLGHWYNIVIVGHTFVHTPWFVSARANRVAGCIVSLSIGQSTTLYRLSHVHDHHRYGNDRQDAVGMTRDSSSTFRNAPNGHHQPLWRYAVGRAVGTIAAEVLACVAVVRMWLRKQPPDEGPLTRPLRLRRSESRAVRMEQTCVAVAWLSLLVVRPDFLISYLAALALAFALVNVHNYYEHFGACPEDTIANSVSHYGKIYNLFAFNDGYHQEHHLHPGCHWRDLPELRRRYEGHFSGRARVVSPVPPVLGFLHMRRPRLDLPTPPVAEAADNGRTA